MTMIPLRELIDKHTSEDGSDLLDVGALNAEMSDILSSLSTQGLTIEPIEMVLINERHANTMIDYLGDLFLRFAEEMGALPEGADVELANFQLYKEHSKISAVYELARTKETIEAARSGLVVPGQQSQGQLTVEGIIETIDVEERDE